MVESHSHQCDHPRTVEGRTLSAEQGIAYDILKYVFGGFETVRLLAFPANGSVQLQARAEADTATPLGLCQPQQALMFHPDDGGLTINNQEVIGLKLPLRAFARIQRDLAVLLPDDRSLEGTPARLLHDGLNPESAAVTDLHARSNEESSQ